MGALSISKSVIRHINLTVLPFWRTYVIILAPLVPINLLISHYDDPAARCAWGVIIMSIYWMTEAVPLVVTGMLPVILFPALGLIDSDAVSKLYLTKSNMLRLTGLMVAVAIENVGLHKRIALRIILLTGTSPKRIMLGFMISTVLISMWISNTAASAMMVPIVIAVLDEIYGTRDCMTQRDTIMPEVADGLFSHHTEFRRDAEETEEDLAKGYAPSPSPHLMLSAEALTNNNETIKLTVAKSMPKTKEELEEIKKKYHTAKIANMLAVCFAANLGGTGVATGTAPNLILLGILDALYESTQLNFATWMLFNVPGMLIITFLGWVWLQAYFFQMRFDDVARVFRKPKNVSEAVQNRWDDEKEAETRARHVIQARYSALGRMRFEEAMTLVLFIFLVATWVFRSPRFVQGWAGWFGSDVSEASTCVLVIFLMFIIPKEPSLPFLRKVSDSEKPPEPSKSLLNWQIIHDKLPWNVVLLMGGAVGMAEVCKTSGLTHMIGRQFAHLGYMSPGAILFVMTTITAFLTELASNAATASIVLPILHSLAMEMNIHPLYLMLPATITTSYSFMLPVANPPNAITYTAAGNMKVSDMAKAGFPMNIIGIIVLNFMVNTYGGLIFDWSAMPIPKPGALLVTPSPGNSTADILATLLESTTQATSA